MKKRPNEKKHLFRGRPAGRRGEWVRSGESLVEVMASAVIFLLMAAILSGAISVCSNIQERSRQTRRENAEIVQRLSSTAQGQGEVQTFRFHASDADGEELGGSVLFSVDATLDTQSVSYTDQTGNPDTVTFYLYGAEGGGGGP